jgi:hypothetical protein
MELHDQIDLSFMVVGHTKFAPDGYFGLIKYRYRRSDVYTYHQLADLIEASSEHGRVGEFCGLEPNKAKFLSAVLMHSR